MFKKKFHWLILALLLVSLELFIFWPKLLYVSLGVAMALEFFLIWQTARQTAIKSGWGNFLILPLAFLVCLVAYVSLIPQDSWDNRFWSQGLLLLNLYFWHNYSRHLKAYLSTSDRPHNLLNFASAFNFLAVFFGLAAVFGLQLFLDLYYWALILVVILLFFCLTYQWFWFNNLNRGHWLFIILIVFLLTQVTWVLYFLPWDYNVLALLLTLGYYLLLNTVKLYLNNNLQRSTFKPLLIFVAVIVLLLILSVRWL